MAPLINTLIALGGAMRERLRTVRDQSERGSVSVEQVIITVALVGIAIALMVVIANAVTSRSSQIQ